ncbi:hypothetical protein ACLFKT_37710, partial [Paraburkholderia sp. BR14261]
MRHRDSHNFSIDALRTVCGARTYGRDAMGFGNPLLLGARRFAAGVDLSVRGVTLVVLSQRIVGAGPVRLEWLASAPLAREALAGAEIVDRAAIVAALRCVFGELPRASAAASLRCAMALPTSATLVAT